MQDILKIIQESGFAHLELGNYLMFLIAFVLTYLAITKNYEPLLLIPISFGIVIANFPLAELGSDQDGIIGLIYKMGIKTEITLSTLKIFTT